MRNRKCECKCAMMMMKKKEERIGKERQRAREPQANTKYKQATKIDRYSVCLSVCKWI